MDQWFSHTHDNGDRLNGEFMQNNFINLEPEFSQQGKDGITSKFHWKCISSPAGAVWIWTFFELMCDFKFWIPIWGNRIYK